MREQNLFGDKQERKAKVKAVFTDYDSWLKKFTADSPKTTDDCNTPQDVYNAIVQWLTEEGKITADTTIVRPFFPGGDYVNTDYPPGAVVVDNPPFSKFMKIVRFYSSKSIPFFLFGNGMSILSASKYCTAIAIARGIIFDNGANVRANFASNLFGDIMAMTAPRLQQLISACPSQQRGDKNKATKLRFPDEVLRVSELHTIANGGGSFIVRRDEGVVVSKPCGQDAFGYSILIGRTMARAKEMTMARAKEMAMAAHVLHLTEEEKTITERLDMVSHVTAGGA